MDADSVKHGPRAQNKIGTVTFDPGVSEVFGRQFALKLGMGDQEECLIGSRPREILYLQACMVWDASSHPRSDERDVCFGG